MFGKSPNNQQSSLRFSSQSTNSPPADSFKSYIHPRSAPIRDSTTFGGHIYSMHQGQQLRKQKQLQQKAYFQQLTRQIQQKQEPAVEPTESTDQSIKSQTQYLSFPWKNQNFPKYQKKHQLENFTVFCMNGNQIIGGALQRDEKLLLKQKKEEQQKQMQVFLKAQIQEKNKKIQEEKKKRQQMELEEQRKFLQQIEQQNEQLLRPEVLENSIEMNNEYIAPIEAQSPIIQEKETTQSESYLSDLCKQLLQQQEKLKNKIKDQEVVINQLQKPRNPVRKPPSKPPQHPNRQNHLKQKQEQDRTRIQAIDQKIANARRKRIENQNKLRNEQNLRKTKRQIKSPISLDKPNSGQIKKVQDTKQSLDIEIKRTQSANTPEHPLVSKIEFVWPHKEIDRQNLDTAGNSQFIYPDSTGAFRTQAEDQLDRFMKEQEDITSFRREISNLSRERMTFTSFQANRRNVRPRMARQAGFPLDIFRAKH